MGHQRTGPLPQTRKWNDVVGLLAAGAGASQLATAVLCAAERGLRGAFEDAGVVETVWLLARLPLAARSDDFRLTLERCGVNVPERPGLMDLVGAVSEAIDAKMPNNRGRTDIGEMAQTCAAETLVHVVGGRLNNLFDTAPEDVRREVAKLATVKQFGSFARDFFSRFLRKCLNYFVSKMLPGQTGEGRRFRTVADQGRFSDALDVHCREASGIVEVVAGEWLSKHNHLTAGALGRDTTASFVAGAMNKLIDELKLRTGGHGN
jgi:hypothetical protein